jgi:hypothetical protein
MDVAEIWGTASEWNTEQMKRGSFQTVTAIKGMSTQLEVLVLDCACIHETDQTLNMHTFFRE